MSKKNRLLLYLVAMILFFLLLLAIIWLVYDYRMHRLEIQPPSSASMIRAVPGAKPTL